jgi:hypothetical protein
MVSQTARSRARPTKTPIPGYKKYSATLGPVNEYDIDVWICENNLHAAEELVRIPLEYGNAASEGLQPPKQLFKPVIQGFIQPLQG